MFQLAYISFAADNFDPNGNEGIDNILKVANQNNQEKQISGMLLFKGGVFIQLLEGAKDEALELYGKIASDLRHEGQKILLKQECEERLFADWTMAYQNVSDIDLEMMSTVIDWKEIVRRSRAGEQIDNQQIKEIFVKFRFKLGKEN